MSSPKDNQNSGTRRVEKQSMDQILDDISEYVNVRDKKAMIRISLERNQTNNLTNARILIFIC